jgi:hypothetical protein
MTVAKLILYLLGVLLKHGNLSIRVMTEGYNFPLSEDILSVDEWDGKTELIIESS